jgi:hypothetical protein
MKRIVLSIALISLFVAGTACARTGFGVRGGYASDNENAFFVGGHLKGLELTPEIALVPNVEVAFFDHVTLYAFNGDAVYAFETTDMNGFVPYIGGELGFNMWQYDDVQAGEDDSETKLVFNALGGIEKRLDERKSLMFELKLGLSDWSPDLKLTAGLSFF